ARQTAKRDGLSDLRPSAPGGPVPRRQLGVPRGIEIGGHKDRTVTAPGTDVVEPLPGRAGSAVYRRDHHTGVRQVRGVLDPSEDLDRPRAVQIVEDQVEQTDSAPRTPAPAPVPMSTQQLLD